MTLKATSMELGDLTDVDGSAPTNNQVLKWNGTSWSPAAEGGGGGTGQWTESTSDGIEYMDKNVGIGAIPSPHSRLLVEQSSDTVSRCIDVLNESQSSSADSPIVGVFSVAVPYDDEGFGVHGLAFSPFSGDSLCGVVGEASGTISGASAYGVVGKAESGTPSGRQVGVHGEASGTEAYGVFGTTDALTGIGLYGRNTVGEYAGYFDGKLFTDSWFSVNDELTVKPNASNSAVKLDMKNGADVSTVELFAAGSNQGGGKIWVSDATGDVRIALDVNNSGVGRVITDELEIRAGSDLAEFFDAGNGSTIEPGSVVVLNQNNPDEITLSDKPYDTRVLGVVSGANGVRSGMLMGQENSVATGDTPVAIAGRVFVRVDESNGKIQPGDLLCSGPIPGTAMKALDRERSWGAIIGKALTRKDENGFVLLLVNLQ